MHSLRHARLANSVASTCEKEFRLINSELKRSLSSVRDEMRGRFAGLVEVFDEKAVTAAHGNEGWWSIAVGLSVTPRRNF